MAEVIQVDKVINAKEGDMRVWWIRNVPGVSEYYIVESVPDACRWLRTLAQADLQNSRVESNAGGLEIYGDDGEWHEWYNDAGEDIDDLLEKEASSV